MQNWKKGRNTTKKGYKREDSKIVIRKNMKNQKLVDRLGNNILKCVSG